MKCYHWTRVKEKSNKRLRKRIIYRIKHTCIFLANYTAQQYIILTPKRAINFREEKLSTAISRVLGLSCEVIMVARPAKLKKQALHCYLIQHKLKVTEKSTIKSNTKRHVTLQKKWYRRDSGITVVVFALLYLRKAVSTWRSEALSLWMIFFSRIAFLSSGDFFFFGGRTTSGATNASMYASIILLVSIPFGKGGSNCQACFSLL